MVVSIIHIKYDKTKNLFVLIFIKQVSSSYFALELSHIFIEDSMNNDGKRNVSKNSDPSKMAL